jgi:hypothetical protein
MAGVTAEQVIARIRPRASLSPSARRQRRAIAILGVQAASMVALIVLIAACAVVGYVLARLWVVAVAVSAVVVFYIGLDSGWWGNGTGDAWQFAMLVVSVVAAAVTTAAVVLGRRRRR